MNRGLAGLRTSFLALGIAAAGASAARADAMTSTAAAAPTALIDYDTSGTVGLTGVTGPNVISFNSVSSGQFNAPSAFSLGSFLSAPLPPGVSTTYENTPFSITYVAQAINGSPLGTQGTPVTITGTLNGTVTGASQSNVTATFNPLPISEFQTGAFLNVASILGSNVSLVPSTTNGGQTTAQAQIVVTAAPLGAMNTPEPATMAIFLTAAAGLGLRRRFRAGA